MSIVTIVHFLTGHVNCIVITNPITKNVMNTSVVIVNVVCNPLVFVLDGRDLLHLQRSSLLLLLHHMMTSFQER